MPIAGRVPGVRRIRLHGGFAFRRVTWSASRTGKPPVIPTPTDVGYDLILSHTVTPSLPDENPNIAGYNWRVKGEYLYIQGWPRRPGIDSLPTGSYPYLVQPNDTIATSLASPIYPGAVASASSVNPLFPNPNNDTMCILGVQAVHGDDFVWPFTALPPVFTSPSVLGA